MCQSDLLLTGGGGSEVSIRSSTYRRRKFGGVIQIFYLPEEEVLRCQSELLLTGGGGSVVSTRSSTSSGSGSGSSGTTATGFTCLLKSDAIKKFGGS